MSEPIAPRILKFFAQLPQQGPGTDTDTLEVLSQLAAKLPEELRVVEMGCGTGRATLALARVLSKASFVAWDLNSEFLRSLESRAKAEGVLERVRTQVVDIEDPPASEGEFDLVWSEGAAYNIGFANALERWRYLLKPGGLCVVSECEWLTDQRPESCQRFWHAAYPAMTMREENLAAARATGYESLGTHVLSRQGWETYYQAIAKALSESSTQLDDEFVAGLREEQAVFAESDQSYGYVFYLLRRT